MGLPVVSYALPALIAIGHARFYHEPPSKWNPLHWLRGGLWPRIRPMLKALQPSSGGYLEATPLTSFVTMALAGSGEKGHPCVPTAVDFLIRSQREDGSWPIGYQSRDCWVTTLSVKALCADDSAEPEVSFAKADRARVKQWILGQQYQEVHPFTNAAPGAWAWTDLPGGVPDADDTCGALVALHALCETEAERTELLPRVEAGIGWLLNLQNRDGGMPTFCRGWGTLPFDRSTAEITAHGLWAWGMWQDRVSAKVKQRIQAARFRAMRYLTTQQRDDGAWIPLWFGNEHAPGEDNPVHGTAQVLLRARGERPTSRLSFADWSNALWSSFCACSTGMARGVARRALCPLWRRPRMRSSALSLCLKSATAPVNRQRAIHSEAIGRGVPWLIEATKQGESFPAATHRSVFRAAVVSRIVVSRGLDFGRPLSCSRRAMKFLFSILSFCVLSVFPVKGAELTASEKALEEALGEKIPEPIPLWPGKPPQFKEPAAEESADNSTHADDPVERESSRPDFAIGLATWHWRQKESPFQFRKDAPPVFLVHASNDGITGGAPIEPSRRRSRQTWKNQPNAFLLNCKSGRHWQSSGKFRPRPYPAR